MKVILYQYSELIRRKDKSIGEACEYTTWLNRVKKNQKQLNMLDNNKIQYIGKIENSNNVVIINGNAEFNLQMQQNSD